MVNAKKIIICIISTFIGLLLVAYLLLGVFWDKPGIDGFSVLHGAVRLNITGEDYVKVGEDRYLFRKGKFQELLETEYSSYSYTDYIKYYDEPLTETDLFKVCLVKKGDEVLKPKGVNVGILVKGVHSAYFAPYEEK